MIINSQQLLRTYCIQTSTYGLHLPHLPGTSQPPYNDTHFIREETGGPAGQGYWVGGRAGFGLGSDLSQSRSRQWCGPLVNTPTPSPSIIA